MDYILSFSEIQRSTLKHNVRDRSLSEPTSLYQHGNCNLIINPIAEQVALFLTFEGGEDSSTNEDHIVKLDWLSTSMRF